MKKLIVGLLIAAAALSSSAFALFSDHPYTITASFLSAEGVVPQNDVVISGVPV